MTSVVFHFGAPDKLDYARRLVRKALGKGVRTVVSATPQVLSGLDQALWDVPPASFLTHCHASSPKTVRNRSAVLLLDGATDWTNDQGAPDTLVNLQDEVPRQSNSFERIIEIVGTEMDDRQLARQRWKQYAAMGYAITSHDLSAAKESR